jgi:hypothetical protein
MFVKEGATGYQAWDSDDENRPEKAVEDTRVGLIPCMATLRATNKVEVSESQLRKHCKAALKATEDGTLRVKQLQKQVVQSIAEKHSGGADTKIVKAAIKKVMPQSPSQLGTVLGRDFVVDAKSVKLVQSKHRTTTTATKSKGTKRKLGDTQEEAALPKVNWKKHCKAVLADAPGKQLKTKVCCLMNSWIESLEVARA